MLNTSCCRSSNVFHFCFFYLFIFVREKTICTPKSQTHVFDKKKFNGIFCENVISMENRKKLFTYQFSNGKTHNGPYIEPLNEHLSWHNISDGYHCPLSHLCRSVIENEMCLPYHSALKILNGIEKPPGLCWECCHRMWNNPFSKSRFKIKSISRLIHRFQEYCRTQANHLYSALTKTQNNMWIYRVVR